MLVRVFVFMTLGIHEMLLLDLHIVLGGFGVYNPRGRSLFLNRELGDLNFS